MSISETVWQRLLSPTDEVVTSIIVAIFVIFVIFIFFFQGRYFPKNDPRYNGQTRFPIKIDHFVIIYPLLLFLLPMMFVSVAVGWLLEKIFGFDVLFQQGGFTLLGSIVLLLVWCVGYYGAWKFLKYLDERNRRKRLKNK
jgi:hypothetical protein